MKKSYDEPVVDGSSLRDGSGVLVVPLLAVHIQDGVLAWPWLAGGFGLAALLMLVGTWGLRDDELPRVALLSAAFFVASLIHVPVPGGPRAHLLLNGLLGVVLGPRAFLAIPVGLLLQAVLFGHGGITALGVNCCVMGIPALLAWLLYYGLEAIPWVRHPWFRTLLVVGSGLTFLLALVYSVVLLATNPWTQTAYLDVGTANAVTFHPITLATALGLSGLGAWMERRMENTPEFPVGLLVGEVAVLATVLLNTLVLLLGGEEDWHALALITLVVHLPLAIVEGMVLGCVVGFLARVQPALLRGHRRVSAARAEQVPCESG